MPTPNQVKRQIDSIVEHLVGVGLSDDQKFPYLREGRRGYVEVAFDGTQDISVALRNIPYTEIYGDLLKDRIYNVKMPDGALLQLMYSFSNRVLLKHCLAFFPPPDIEEFQNNPDIYLTEEVFLEVVSKRVVPFPIRFDYDAREPEGQLLAHPKSHLTLGQYENCRIPVSSPLTPIQFVEFILRNFYRAAFEKYCGDFPTANESFAKTLLPEEEALIHIVIPGQSP